jgi:hypothetical protein
MAITFFFNDSLLINLVRFSQKDDIWLSPAYQTDVAWIGVIMYRPYGKEVSHHPYFQAFQNLMMDYGMYLSKLELLIYLLRMLIDVVGNHL